MVTPNLFTQPWQKNEMKTFRGLFPSTSKLSYGVIAKSMKKIKTFATNHGRDKSGNLQKFIPNDMQSSFDEANIGSKGSEILRSFKGLYLRAKNHSKLAQRKKACTASIL